MGNTVRKPLLLNETGEKLVEAMTLQNAYLASIVADRPIEMMSWKMIQAIVRQGLASKFFKVGDQFIVSWTDKASTEVKKYEIPFDVVHFGKVELEDGSKVDGLYLQAHYGLPFSVPLSYEFLKKITASEGRSYQQNCYYYEALAPYKLLKPGKDYTIGDVITKDVNVSWVRIGTYGTSIDTHTNSMGTSRGIAWWSHSPVRAYLNSDDARWRYYMHEGRAYNTFISSVPTPSCKRDGPGFLSGFDDDFLACLGKVKVVTQYPNQIEPFFALEIGRTENTFDTFFLPSASQLYAIQANTGSGDPEYGLEGEAFDYWKQAVGTSAPTNKSNAFKTQYLSENGMTLLTTAVVDLRGTKQSPIWEWVKIIDNCTRISSGPASGPDVITPVCVIC